MAQSEGPTNAGRRGDELDLVVGAQRGDHGAFERLYRRHVGRVYALCLRMVADVVEAETLTQDVFVRVWEKFGSYRAERAFGAWLRRVAINVVIEDRRKRARQVKRFAPGRDTTEIGVGAGGATTVPGEGPVPSGAAHASRTEAAIDLERAMAQLPPGARETFVLHDVEGYRHREIAAMMGVATGTVRAQLHRARRLLREALGDSEEVLES